MRPHAPSTQQALGVIELDVTHAALGGVALTPHGRLRAEIANQLVTSYPEAESRPHARRIRLTADKTGHTVATGRPTSGATPQRDPCRVDIDVWSRRGGASRWPDTGYFRGVGHG